MLKKYPDRVFVNFGLDFEAQIGYARKLSEAAEAVQGRLAIKKWSYTTERYVLRVVEKRYYLSLDFARFGFTGLGLDAWMSGLNDHVALFRLGLEKMGVQKLKRAGFKAQAFIPLDMTHAETCELMFGSFLVEAKELESICGKPEDLLVQLHGNYKGLKTQTIIAPVNAEQSAQSFIANGNLELLIEPRLFDTGLKDFRDRIAKDCLLVDSDLSRTDVTPDAIQAFAKDSLEAAGQIAEATVYRLKRMLTKRGGRNGNTK
jgi:hypothetical protein